MKKLDFSLATGSTVSSQQLNLYRNFMVSSYVRFQWTAKCTMGMNHFLELWCNEKKLMPRTTGDRVKTMNTTTSQKAMQKQYKTNQFHLRALAFRFRRKQNMILIRYTIIPSTWYFCQFPFYRHIYFLIKEHYAIGFSKLSDGLASAPIVVLFWNSFKGTSVRWQALD